MKKQQKGFTLIELVLVIIVLGVLAAVAVPKFVDLQSEASTNTASVSARGMETAYGEAVLKDTAGIAGKPDVDFIATFIKSKTPPTVAATGISVVNGNKTITMNTFTLADCSAASATAATTDEVACVTTTITP